ncbi:MAG: proline--tRNA ligase [Firmicutes bacterium]|nr:proline--tRNA ligase [Bacillota bacterium]
MRVSQLLVPTLREVPAEAEVVSHQLLVRAGFIRKTAAGVYTYLPLALRVLEKIEKIVREEMARQGGQEILMPIIQPAELWKESSRWDVYGPELFRLKDRHGRDFCLGPTHEEIITALVRGEVSSYKQLPLLLFQVQNKYRDERRPRFGLMRGREFIMKDLYSFDMDEEGLHTSYQKMYEAYSRVYDRCGLKYRVVEADSGAIGGSDTHEFMVLAASGEATVVYCSSSDCDYAANVERAHALFGGESSQEEPESKREVHTPTQTTIKDVAIFLGESPKKTIKTLIYKTEDGLVAALVRGDREVNEVKLYNALGCLHLELANAGTIQDVTGAQVGYAGPVGLDMRIVADPEVNNMVNAIAGANKTGYHLVNVNPGRDFKVDTLTDIRMVQAGEPCPRCGSALDEAQGIEVGQIFKLGDKYSRALGAVYLDDKGQEQYIIMGCYGIGVTRTMAASVEQNHDQQGIIWPASIAPFQVVVIPVSTKDEAQVKMAEEIYNKLLQAGVEALIDDRPERAGVKFKDADLVGYPLRITVGSKGVKSGQAEVTERKTGETVMVPQQDITYKVCDMLEKDV